MNGRDDAPGVNPVFLSSAALQVSISENTETQEEAPTDSGQREQLALVSLVSVSHPRMLSQRQWSAAFEHSQQNNEFVLPPWKLDATPQRNSGILDTRGSLLPRSTSGNSRHQQVGLRLIVPVAIDAARQD